jgi:hypothetical protein
VALFSFHVSSARDSYITQHRADDWQGAREALLASGGFHQFSEEQMPSTVGAPLVGEDVFPDDSDDWTEALLADAGRPVWRVLYSGGGQNA